MQPLAADGMHQADFVRMQRKPTGQRIQLRAVQEIAAHRAADMRHMDANLMRATRFQLQPDKRTPIALLQRFIMRDGRLSIG